MTITTIDEQCPGCGHKSAIWNMRGSVIRCDGCGREFKPHYERRVTCVDGHEETVTKAGVENCSSCGKSIVKTVEVVKGGNAESR